MSLFHVLRRKLATFTTTVRACENWPAITLAKIGLGPQDISLQFRSGLELRPVPPLKATWGEIFEPAIADLYGIRNCAPDLIIDVGANIGAFSCFAARTHPEAEIHSFEPSTVQADKFEENVALNSLSNVSLHRQAVTKDGREVTFSIHGSGGSSGLFFHEGGRPIPLQSVSLDSVDFSRSRSLFMKFDCEGAEGELIEWICSNLSLLPPDFRLACEYHPWCPVPMAESLARLRSNGLQAEHRVLFDEDYLFAARS